MDSKIKTLWINALKSGQYKQGRDQLRSSEHITNKRRTQEQNYLYSYCSLGVLSHLLDPKGISWKPYMVKLPPTISAKSEITREEQSALIGMNDSGKSFPEIADFIHKNM